MFFTQCGVFCGAFHQKSKSPQILVVICVVIWTYGEIATQITTSICGDLVKVGSKVRGHYEDTKNMFDNMYTLYLECFYEE